MGLPQKALPARLFVAMLAADTARFQVAAVLVAQAFGPTDYLSDVLPFTETHYYDDELGAPIFRRFVTVAPLMAQDDLAGIKRRTIEMEAALARLGRRTVNLDPGYLTAAKVVLATTKDREHRIYIGDGIYAEVTLHYRHGRFHPWPWTYPDYCSPPYLAEFARMRDAYMRQLRSDR